MDKSPGPEADVPEKANWPCDGIADRHGSSDRLPAGFFAWLLQPCSDGNRDSLAFIVDSGEHRRAEGKVDGPTTAELKARTIESALGDPLRKWAALKRERDKG